MSHVRRKAPTTLDPRGVFVFDTRSLGRDPGASREESRTVPAPDDFRVGLAGVPRGTGVDVSVRLESVTEGVLATGTATVSAVGECARCLDPLTLSIVASFQELYRYASSLDDDNGEVLVLDGSLLDLEPVVRDAVVLELPLSPLCRPDCPGLCATCGIRLADAPAGHHHPPDGHPAWQVLRAFNGHSEQVQNPTDRIDGVGDRQEE